MPATNVNVRVDTDLKQSAEALFNDPGLNMFSAITMFLKSAVSHDGIPFEVKRLSPNAETIAALASEQKLPDKQLIRSCISGRVQGKYIRSKD